MYGSLPEHELIREWQPLQACADGSVIWLNRRTGQTEQRQAQGRSVEWNRSQNYRQVSRDYKIAILQTILAGHGSVQDIFHATDLSLKSIYKQISGLRSSKCISVCYSIPKKGGGRSTNVYKVTAKGKRYLYEATRHREKTSA